MPRVNTGRYSHREAQAWPGWPLHNTSLSPRRRQDSTGQHRTVIIPGGEERRGDNNSLTHSLTSRKWTFTFFWKRGYPNFHEKGFFSTDNPDIEFILYDGMGTARHPHERTRALTHTHARHAHAHTHTHKHTHTRTACSADTATGRCTENDDSC